MWLSHSVGGISRATVREGRSVGVRQHPGSPTEHCVICKVFKERGIKSPSESSRSDCPIARLSSTISICQAVGYQVVREIEACI
jgi:hypothetical protein